MINILNSIYLSPDTRIARCLRLAGLALFLAVVALIMPSTSLAQSIDWERSTSPGPIARIENSMVYCDGKMWMFGGYDLNFNRMNDLWEYDTVQKTWTEHTPSPVDAPWPSRRAGHAMACDPVGHRIILFGGWTDNGNYLKGTLLNDTWEWSTNDKSWSNVTPAGTKPVPRRGAKMVYDSSNSRIVMFGGVDGTTYFPNPFPGGTQEKATWVWNLTERTWTAMQVTSESVSGRQFPGRTYHGMVYNTVTNRIWIYGGIGIIPGSAEETAVDLTDIWEMDPVTFKWIDLTPTSGAEPAGRGWAGVAFDDVTDQMIVHAGWNSLTQLDYVDDNGAAETWAFNGTSWRQIFLSLEIPGDNGALLSRDSHAMVFDPGLGRLIIYGAYMSDVLEFNVSLSKIKTAVLTTWPPQQDEHSMVYDPDRDRLMMYGGGSPEMWELSPATMTWKWHYVRGPDGRIGHAMAYESPRRKIILFGGRQRFQGGLCGTPGEAVCEGSDDTWEWDGEAKTWTKRTVTGGSPPGRYDHAMVYDTVRNRIVLFGGRDLSGTPLNDTWEWDGTTWTNVPTASGLAARFGHAMAYDPVRKTIVLFGGGNGSVKFNDTWERNSAAESVWTLRSSTGPSARVSAALSSSGDPAGGVLMVGGMADTSVLMNDAWVWDGATWTQTIVPRSTIPTPRQKARMVYDPLLRRAILFGGRDRNGVCGDVLFANVTPAVSPTPVLVTPSQSEGESLTLTALFRATSADDMTEIQLLINDTDASTGGIFLSFLPNSGTLQLRREDGSYVSGILGSADVLTNGVVSINLSGANVSKTATDVALTLAMAFSEISFNGPKNIYVRVHTGSEPPADWPWQQKGTFFVNNGNSTPTGVSVLPSSGSGASQIFTAVYRDMNGVNDLQQAYFLVNTTLSISGAVHLYYMPAYNRLHMLDDSGQPVQPGAVPGSAGTLSNGRFSVNVAQVRIVKSETDLTLTLPITFTSTFAGPKTIYLFCVDSAGAHTGAYQQFGTFTVSFTGNRLSIPAIIEMLLQ